MKSSNHQPLKTIGLLGGVSWTSTHEYYRRINEAVFYRMGGYNSARILMKSVNFADILGFQATGDTSSEAAVITRELKTLEKAGADFLLICSNTTNKTIKHLVKEITIPILNLPKLVAEAVQCSGIKTVGLLGTKYVMYGEFYQEYFKNLGIRVLVPDSSDGATVHTIIYDELVKGAVRRSSALRVDTVSRSLLKKGAESIIYGCTELPLLLRFKTQDYPVLDTVDVHVAAAMNFLFTDEQKK